MRPCPHPEKQAYSTWEAAQWDVAIIRERDAPAHNLRPYRCRCTGIHIGNTTPVDLFALVGRLVTNDTFG